MTLEVYRSTGPPHLDLALESWLLERARGGQVCASLCSWPQPTVVLGYAQPEVDVDLEWCREQGIPVLRRLTGGTGVVHHNDLGASLALPGGHPWARGLVALYGRFLDVLEPALLAAGGEVQRLAVLCPPHLAEQWQSEMEEKFHIPAELVLPSTVTRLERRFDGIISSMTLHHVENVAALFRVFHGLLNDGGFLALADLEDLVGNHDKRERYRQMAEELRQAIGEGVGSEALDLDLALSFLDDAAGHGDQAIAHLRVIGPESEAVYYLFVVDADVRLVGVVSLRQIVVAVRHGHQEGVWL